MGATGGTGRVIGGERRGSLDEHEGRAALRRLVVGLFDAWDAGDGDAFVAAFADDATFGDPFTARSTGRDAIAAHFARWRGWEPWSVHWVTNEQIDAAEEQLVGTWLWSARSDVDGGRRSTWSGGDLMVTAVRAPGGWRLRELTFGDRYRTPLDEGWLRTPFVVPGSAGESRTPRTPPAVTVAPIVPPSGASEDARVDALREEPRVRAVLADLYLDLEHGAPPGTTAERWMPAGDLIHVDGDGAVEHASGTAAVASLLGTDAAGTAAWMRVLASVWIDVQGDAATARWRDLWTAERRGEARWLSHAWEVHLVADGGAWRFASVRRTRVLDEAYGGGA